jgi:hypothetical protein
LAWAFLLSITTNPKIKTDPSMARENVSVAKVIIFYLKNMRMIEAILWGA